MTVQSKTVITKNNDEVPLLDQKETTNQIADLFRLVQNTTEKMSDKERVNQISHEIHSDTYFIDLDALSDNIANDFFLVKALV